MKEKILSIKENRRIRITIILIILCIFSYIYINMKESISVYSRNLNLDNEIEKMDIVLGGNAAGIKLLATGVLVMGIDREDTSLEIGDVILKVNENKIETNSELLKYAKESNGKSLSLLVSRKGNQINVSITPIVDTDTNEYKLGLWVKDSSAGVGTITFFDRSSLRFAALGHAVTETKENYILPITSGGITETSIYAIKKGAARLPGELRGTITNNIIGEISGNTEKGIYGKIYDKEFLKNKKSIEILKKSEIKEGKAIVYCTLEENSITEYEINIEKVLLNSSGNKNMIINITDPKLLNITGGIVQGMSGSPIVQNGKLIGAVTHVFLNDPTRGYGVFIENMIEDMCKIN